MEKRKKRWSCEETKALLYFYTTRKNEFSLPRKRRLAFANVVEDLVSAGFDSEITAHQCEIKMQTLLRAYKNANDNSRHTGASPCNQPFFSEMENIFGDKPIQPVSECLTIGIELLDKDGSVSLPTLLDTPPESSIFVFPQNEENTIVSASATNSSLSIVSCKPRRLSKSEYLKAKLKAAEERFQQRQKFKIKAMKEKEDIFQIKKALFEQILKK